MKRLYVVVRSDIPPGLQMAQACHAAYAFGATRTEEDVGDNLVVLQAPREELERLVAEAQRGVCTCVPFHEPDLRGELTAAAFGVGARRILSTLPLALRAA